MSLPLANISRVKYKLNLTLQAVGLMRSEQEPAMEDLQKNCSSVPVDVRATASRYPELKNAVADNV